MYVVNIDLRSCLKMICVGFSLSLILDMTRIFDNKTDKNYSICLRKQMCYRKIVN